MCISSDKLVRLVLVVHTWRAFTPEAHRLCGQLQHAAGTFQVNLLHLWDRRTCTSSVMYVSLPMSYWMSIYSCDRNGREPPICLQGERYRSPTGFGSAPMFESVHSGQDQKEARTTKCCILRGFVSMLSGITNSCVYYGCHRLYRQPSCQSHVLNRHVQNRGQRQQCLIRQSRERYNPQRKFPDAMRQSINEALLADRGIDWPDAVGTMGSMHRQSGSDAAETTCTGNLSINSALSPPNAVADVTLQHLDPFSAAGLAGLPFSTKLQRLQQRLSIAKALIFCMSVLRPDRA